MGISLDFVSEEAIEVMGKETRDVRNSSERKGNGEGVK